MIDFIATVCALPCFFIAAYLMMLTVASRRRAVATPRTPSIRFDIVVPAHNEASGIAASVESLLAVDYPRDLYRVLVVADNCTDATPAIAAAAGAQVLVRNDHDRRGKGYALEFAFHRCVADGSADAVVVVDADSVVSRNVLRVLSSRLEEGARALQIDYGVINAGVSWRTRLMRLAFTAIHTVRSLGRERLGLSCGLRGNGMCFAVDVLRTVPAAAFSVVEDIEYGIALGRHGIRVEYVDDAGVEGQMCATEEHSRSQRRRWEHGRARLARAHALGLVRDALRRRDPVLADLAIDLLVPPLGTVVIAIACGLTMCIAVSAASPLHVAPWVWLVSAAGVAVYVGRAAVLTEHGLRTVADLLCVPGYLVWKVTLRFKPDPARAGEWVRTAREERS